MEFLDGALELGFFTGGEIKHFFCVMQEDCALGFGLRGVDGTGEDADFGIFGAFF